MSHRIAWFYAPCRRVYYGMAQHQPEEEGDEEVLDELCRRKSRLCQQYINYLARENLFRRVV